MVKYVEKMLTRGLMKSLVIPALFGSSLTKIVRNIVTLYYNENNFDLTQLKIEKSNSKINKNFNKTNKTLKKKFNKKNKKQESSSFNNKSDLTYMSSTELKKLLISISSVVLQTALYKILAKQTRFLV